MEVNPSSQASSSSATKEFPIHTYISQHFMESQGSLPHSQEPSTGPYPS
jgi:hypothetical protein